jgi:heme-degrading monooxygenase HmoA
MATFSLWENEESMRAYAYSDSRHLEAIKLTRKLNWYTEEMFARFRPYRYEGAWF